MWKWEMGYDKKDMIFYVHIIQESYLVEDCGHGRRTMCFFFACAGKPGGRSFFLLFIFIFFQSYIFLVIRADEKVKLYIQRGFVYL